MDYNQSNGQNKTPDFFTAGAGTNNPEANNFEAENNLDLSNKQIEWQNTTPDNMQNIGNRVTNITKEQNSINGNLETPQLGQIIELESPKKPDPAQIAATAIAREPYQKEVIKTKEVLSKEGIQEIDNAVNKFNQDGNASDFYEIIRRGMTEDHLENSYDRKLAA